MQQYNFQLINPHELWIAIAPLELPLANWLCLSFNLNIANPVTLNRPLCLCRCTIVQRVQKMCVHQCSLTNLYWLQRITEQKLNNEQVDYIE